jgi:hypothetical protein
MANYTVNKGDTIWQIANEFDTSVTELTKINNLSNPDFIAVGQTLKTEGTPDPVTTNTSSKANITNFGFQSNSTNTLFAVWTWDKTETEHYEVLWSYDTGNGVWFIGSDSTTKVKQSTYNYPNNATRVKFKVKPVAKSTTKYGKTTTPWTAGWSTEKTFNVSDTPPQTPSAPQVTIEDYKLTARLENISLNATQIEFEIVRDDKTVISNNAKATITMSAASYSCTVNVGHEYKVRCRSTRGNLVSGWSPYSASVGTIPAVPSGITKLQATSETSVYLEWGAVQTAETYDIEYATKKNYFDGSDQTTSKTGIESNHFEITGLESGLEYFFRVRAVNKQGGSEWCGIKSIIIGKAPAAPTTWSSTTTAIVGEPLNLYWVHNTEDGSSQTYAKLELTVGGKTTVQTIKNSTDEDEKDKTSVYAFKTSGYSAGTKLEWRVQTAGITGVYGDWSIKRTVDIYAPATLTLDVTDNSGSKISTLESFPINVRAVAGPSTQSAIGYHISVTANATYETVDYLGNPQIVKKGTQVYSRHYDISGALSVSLSASDLDLENNIEYTLTCTVAMNSGLSATASTTFVVGWAEISYEPNAEIIIDDANYTALIRPHCTDENGELIEGVLLSVYRREFDGGFTELAKNLQNTQNTFITDPHPALDYARYRVVATTAATGTVSYFDIPAIPVGGKAVIIQWDDEWSTFDNTDEALPEDRPWNGSMLALPYNIDVSDSNSADVSLVEYIGRKHPVSYYGTQLGVTSSWNVEIPKDDIDTLYALRRLMVWMGDVYVREPSGSGYWAHIVVSFSQTHRELTIPVAIKVTRVEGGA